MFPIKLLKLGEQTLRSYCKNRNHLYEVIEKDNGFKIRTTNVNWVSKLLRQGIMMEVDKDDDGFYLYLNSNIVYELYIDELAELIAFIDKIRDKNQEQLDLRLFKDKK